MPLHIHIRDLIGRYEPGPAPPRAGPGRSSGARAAFRSTLRIVGGYAAVCQTGGRKQIGPAAAEDSGHATHHKGNGKPSAFPRMRRKALRNGAGQRLLAVLLAVVLAILFTELGR